MVTVSSCVTKPGIKVTNVSVVVVVVAGGRGMDPTGRPSALAVTSMMARAGTGGAVMAASGGTGVGGVGTVDGARVGAGVVSGGVVMIGGARVGAGVASGGVVSGGIVTGGVVMIGGARVGAGVVSGGVVSGGVVMGGVVRVGGVTTATAGGGAGGFTVRVPLA